MKKAGSNNLSTLIFYHQEQTGDENEVVRLHPVIFVYFYLRLIYICNNASVSETPPPPPLPHQKKNWNEVKCIRSEAFL